MISSRRFPFIFLSLVVLVLFLSSCAGDVGALSNWPGLSVDPVGGMAYVSSGSHVYAIDTSNGVEKWRFPSKPDSNINFFAAATQSADGQLIVGSYKNQLFSIDPIGGGQKWIFDQATSHFVASPLITSQGIYAPNADGVLYALDLAGNVRWTFKTARPLWGTPASDGDVIYLPAMDHHIYALNAQNGQVIWETDNLGGAVVGSPTLGNDGVMYAGTFGKSLIAVDRQSGKVLWKLPTSGWVWSGPVMDGDNLYFGDVSGTLYAVNAADGSIRWSKQLDDSRDRAIIDKPLLLGDTLYFCSENGRFYAVDPTSGTPRWSAPKTLDGKLYGSPVVIGEQILVPIMQGKSLLVALDENGNPRWAYMPVK